EKINCAVLIPDSCDEGRPGRLGLGADPFQSHSSGIYYAQICVRKQSLENRNHLFLLTLDGAETAKTKNDSSLDIRILGAKQFQEHGEGLRVTISSRKPGRNGDPESLPMLLELLRSKNANVQRRIVFCLGCLGAVEGQEKKVIPVLEALLSDTDLGVVNAAAVALEGIGPKAQAARPALVARIRDQDGTINFF